jgi:hypothetical protein
MTADLTPRLRRPSALFAFAVAITLAAAACGSAASPTPGATPSPSPAASASPSGAPSTPTPSATPAASPSAGGSPGATPDPADAATYRAIEDQVAAIRGIEPTARLEPTILDEAALRARLQEMFDEENPPNEIRESEILLKALGLLPADASLRDLYLDLMSSQVAGYYDLEADQMFLVSRTGGIGPSEKANFAHEFVHALQDQHFQADRLVNEEATKGQGDRALAWRSVVEGDASLAQLLWLQNNLTPAEIQQVMTESSDPETTAALNKAPAILRESLLFPYSAGAQFDIAAWQQGGWPAVDALYDKLPESTEQILHPEKYLAGEMPKAVSVPAADVAAALGDGWTVADEDTAGEFFLSTWLRERAATGPAPEPGGTPVPASGAAAGWGGDRTVLLTGPGDAYALVMATAWDTPDDAAEFASAARAAVKGLPGASAVGDGSGDAVTVLLASDDTVLGRLQAALPK